MNYNHTDENLLADSAHNSNQEDLLRTYQNEIEALRNENNKQKQIIRQYQTLLTRDQVIMTESYKSIVAAEASKTYKLALLPRRFQVQVLRNECGGKKAFLRWFFNKLIGRNVGLSMHDFDALHPVGNKLLDQANLSRQTLALYMGTNIEGTVLKKSRRFFIFAVVPYYDIGGGQRFAQLAKTLDAMGYQVYYIHGFESGESQPKSMYVPALKHIHIDSYAVEDMAEDLQSDSVLIFECPDGRFRPYLDYANEHGIATVYEHVDNWDSSLGELFYYREEFSRFVRDVAHVTVTARILGEKIEEIGRTDYLYCPNAVDASLFEPARSYEKPDDLVTGKKTLLYFGSLWGEWFDWNLIAHVAKNCNCTINLIGDCQGIADKIKKLPANIHFLGLKKQTELPAYLHYSDIALLPFKNDNIGKYVSPLKVFEYIAMNKPVLSTALDDLRGYPNVVLSDDKDVWVRAVNEGMVAADAAVFTAENNWYARCNQILDLVGRPQAVPPSVSIIVLNHNNMNVIFRCVNSLLAFSGAYQAEIIVVDNDSTDGSYECLLTEYGDKIKLIKNHKNGCACGRNLGVRHATGEMLYFLDSDQWVIGEHYLDAALEVMEQNPHIGAVGWAAGWFEPDSVAGPITDYLPQRGIPAPWVMFRTDIAYLGSDGMLIKKSLFEEVGGFDEAYDPTCFEDTDLSLKIRHAGYELAYCPYSAVMHLPHQTTNAGSKAHADLMQRNGEYFASKWNRENPKLLQYYLRE